MLLGFAGLFTCSFCVHDISKNYKNVNDACLDFSKTIPQHWSLSVQKIEVYYIYALIRLILKVLTFKVLTF